MSSGEASQKTQPTYHQTIVGAKNKKCGKRKWYLLLSNPSKTTHLGTILRCAAAFQVHQVLLVGYDKFNCQGSFGSHLFLDIVVFPSWERVQDYLRRGGDDDGDEKGNDNEDNSSDQNKQRNSSTNEIPAVEESQGAHCSITSQSPAKNITIIGILGACGGGEEIFSPDGMAVYGDSNEKHISLTPPKDAINHGDANHNQDRAPCSPHRSFPISARPFSNNVCFLLSKDKRGLPPSQARICTGFVHVPHLTFDDSPPSQMPDSNDCISTTAPKPSLSKPAIAPSITQCNLLDTATTLSIVLHHFTAWACYAERMFTENQKFVKDVKPNARRRLCRVIGENKEKVSETEGTMNIDSNTDQEAMDAMMFWKENEDTCKGGDY